MSNFNFQINTFPNTQQQSYIYHQKETAKKFILGYWSIVVICVFWLSETKNFIIFWS